MSNQEDVIKEREEKLVELHRRGEEEQIENLAQKLGLNYVNLALVPIDRDNLSLIPEAEAQRTRAVVIRKKGNVLKVGMVDPTNHETKQVLERLEAQDFKLEIFLISPSSLKKALAEFKFIPSQTRGQSISGVITLEKVERAEKEVSNFQMLKEKIAGAGRNGDTSFLLEAFLNAALKLEASDIHIEPQEFKTRVRFRLDGVLQEAGEVSQNTYQFLLSRVKLLSGLQINIQNIPQDGRFTIKEKNVDVEVRTSVIPGAYGEYIVLRILNPSAIKLEIKDLGIRDYLWQEIKKEIEKPTGIILVTGPTGSGKTTTLYAFIKYLATVETKIITLEDPIEYHLAGISQSQIEPKKGYTFAAGLRSVLRQDPDIILVGEIRDDETADTALHAALTGHLVFSTIHTNDASGAIPRFLDMNAKPQILATALNTAIGQRLVRKLCAYCKKEAKISPDQLAKIRRDLYSSSGVEKIFPWPKEKNIKIFEAAGCPRCASTGYKGRVGVFEVLLVDENMEKLIGQSPSHQDVLTKAKQAGFITMYQDGLMRVLVGETTLAEVERVTSAST